MRQRIYMYVLFVDVLQSGVLCTQTPPLLTAPKKSFVSRFCIFVPIYDHILGGLLTWKHVHLFVYGSGIEHIYSLWRERASRCHLLVQKLSGNPTWQSVFGALKYLVEEEVADLGGSGTNVDLIFM